MQIHVNTHQNIFNVNRYHYFIGMVAVEEEYNFPCKKSRGPIVVRQQSCVTVHLAYTKPFLVLCTGTFNSFLPSLDSH